MNKSAFKIIFIFLLLHSGLLSAFNPLSETAAKKIQIGLAKIKRHRDAIKVQTFNDLIRVNAIQLLSNKDHDEFHDLNAWEDKIIYLLYTFNMLSDQYKQGNELLIEELKIVNANETDAVYVVKILRHDSYHTVYVVKIPRKKVAEQECLGLFWVRELLNNLPRDSGWPLLNFHEAMFWNEAEENAIIFLHAAKGMPWCSYITESTIEENLTNFYSLGKTLGTLEAKFIKNIGSPKMCTITFPDFHPGNVFFDKKNRRFSYIDLHDIGISAKSYFSNECMAKQDSNKVAKGLETMIFLLKENKNLNMDSSLFNLPKIILNLKQGYLEAFASFNDKSKRQITLLINNI